MAFIPHSMIGIGMGIGIGGGGGGGGGSLDPPEIGVNAVNFDGTNDYLNRGAGLTGAVDAKTAIMSLWVLKGVDDDEIWSIGTAPERIVHRVNAANLHIFKFMNAAAATIWTGRINTTLTIADGWTHVLIALNSASEVRTVHLNDVLATITFEEFLADGVIDFTTTDIFIGRQGTQDSGRWNGDLAEFYLTNEFLDMTVVANRRKFISANGKPVDLNADGSRPTGTAALVYQSGPTDDWHTNKGAGEGFTETGALTDASTSPSD